MNCIRLSLPVNRFTAQSSLKPKIGISFRDTNIIYAGQNGGAVNLGVLVEENLHPGVTIYILVYAPCVRVS
jgi:hypothetical protein